MDKNIPFGYTYTDKTLTVKLRVKESKFITYALNVYPYILGKPGFVIFTAVVELNTQDHKDLNVKLSKLREDKS
jgi:hypothetical protein